MAHCINCGGVLFVDYSELVHAETGLVECFADDWQGRVADDGGDEFTGFEPVYEEVA